MFSLFKKKSKSIKVNDIVWLKEEIKWKACISEYNKNSSTIFIAWFDESFEKLKETFKIAGIKKPLIYLSRQASWYIPDNTSVIFIEHYPLHSKEEELFQKLHLMEVQVFSSLDEPLFKQFGGDNISSLMQRMGMNEEESIQHPLISTSINNAQTKIAAKVPVEQQATSQADWLIKNLLA